MLDGIRLMAPILNPGFEKQRCESRELEKGDLHFQHYINEK